ncbi:PREDICTED: WAT1-related protein At5g40210-like [Tarenaya hassleriana]|uniref:WAT1-related protein At5g40210-like n=1 Tax=Tarenaya hassleriana TaxID=28532 RepID=UPI00053CA972|nr:PREDICTED: WAT1-related protein At5g40210-like [Tarenaya hassleriana]
MERRLCDRDGAIFAAMVGTEFTNVVVNTLFKAATSKGMSPFVFLVYNYAIGALLLLLPFASLSLSLRSSSLPPLSSSILCKIGLLGLLGSVFLMLGFNGIKYSSPTLSSAMANLTPAFTFILAVIFRMEKVSIKKKTSIAKVTGTALSIGGAFVATLYHGPAVFSALSPASDSLLRRRPLHSPSEWATGGGLLALEYIIISVAYILQAHVMNRYPSAVIVTFSRNVCISVMCGMVGAIAEKNNPSAWTLRFDITLVSIVAGGILNTWYFVIHSWAVSHKGPLYLALFKPLSIVIAVATTAVFLGDSLYLGSLVGGILISTGFYMVMWGKAKEEKTSDHIVSPPSDKVPLLRNYTTDQA